MQPNARSLAANLNLTTEVSEDPIALFSNQICLTSFVKNLPFWSTLPWDRLSVPLHSKRSMISYPTISTNPTAARPPTSS